MKAQSASPLWMRRMFQLSILMMLVPVYFFYQQLRPGSPKAGEDRLLLEQLVGSWQVALVEQHSETPGDGRDETGFRDYQLQICETCADTLKAAFISTERPSAREYGEIFSGGPTVFHSRLSFSRTESKPSKVWLTLEGWDGHVRQVSIP